MREQPDCDLATPPPRLLLATDLSPRCDRALARAAQLAEEWQGELIALNVLDVAAWPDQTMAWVSGAERRNLLEIARRQLASDLAGLKVRSSPRMAIPGDAARAIRNVAHHADCGLVVTGISQGEAFHRFLMGSTVKRLANSLHQPLLVVRNRVQGTYRNILVTTDYMPASRQPLLTAAGLFKGKPLTLYHAGSGPAPGVIEQLPADVVVQKVTETGPLETKLTQYVRSHNVELVVIGVHRRNWAMNILIGNSATKLLDWLPCDVLLVHLPDMPETCSP